MVDDLDEAYRLADAIGEELRARFAPYGWSVRSEPGPIPPRYHYRFEHPLTGTFDASVDPTSDTLRTQVANATKRPEFDLIAAAPIELPHTALISSLRQNARGWKWPLHQFQHLVTILEVHGALTPSEADWLRRAGPCWPSEDEVEELAGLLAAAQLHDVDAAQT